MLWQFVAEKKRNRAEIENYIDHPPIRLRPS